MQNFKTMLLMASMISAPFWAHAAWYDNYSGVVVYGDSLSDNGNLNDEIFSSLVIDWDDYTDGRFSNGPVWSDYMESEIEANGLVYSNYAHGGARAGNYKEFFITDFEEQVDESDRALSSGRFGERVLASIAFGGNDGLQLAEGDSAEDIVSLAVDGLKGGIFDLLDEGIRDFVVWDVPDLALTPRIHHFNPSLTTVFTGISNALNSAIDDVISFFNDSPDYSDLTVTKFAFSSAVAERFYDPAAYGFADSTLPCLFESSNQAQAFGQDTRRCDAPDTLVFYDGIHPSSAAHAQIYDAFGATMTRANSPSPVPLPASFWLLGGALGVLGLRRSLH